MSKRKKHVALVDVLLRVCPEEDPEALVLAQRVLVDGAIVTNPRAQIRADAVVAVEAVKRLRGADKLGDGLRQLGFDVDGMVAVDVGAAAGGFTTALLEAGATRVYAVDVGHGQLLGSLRQDPRVVNLERTNVAALDATLVPEPVDVVTMDLSYLSVADAVGQLDRLDYAPDAALIALVKPTFELHAPTVETDPAAVRHAAALAITEIDRHQWQSLAATIPAPLGAHGAVELFVRASRRREPPGG